MTTQIVGSLIALAVMIVIVISVIGSGSNDRPTTGESKMIKEIGNRILKEGVWVENERTGKRCLTIPLHIEQFDGAGRVPIDTTRKQMFKSPIMELIGYIRGYTDAQQFADIGSPTWFGNSNETPAWLANPNRKGNNDCGAIYQFSKELKEIHDKLIQGVDDRGLIATAWKPETFPYASLRPCMFQHQFQLIDGKLHLVSLQRSSDVPMAGSWNSIQSYVLLNIMAKVTGHDVGNVTRVINHAHVYEDQLGLFEEQMGRGEIDCSPRMTMNVEGWDDIYSCSKEDFSLRGYRHHAPIHYPFTV